MAVELIYPLPAGITSIVTFFQYVNTLSGGAFGNTMVGVFFIITFISMSRSDNGRNETEKVFVAASFVAMLFSFFFMIIDLVAIQTVFITTVATIFSVLLVKQSRGGF